MIIIFDLRDKSEACHYKWQEHHEEDCPVAMESQSEKWSRYAQVYDKRRFALMPGYPEMIHATMQALPFRYDQPFDVLEVGIGTGNLAAAILERFPAARLTGIDVASGMLDIAGTRLSPYRDRVRLELSDLESMPITGEWDAVVSSLTFRCLSRPRKAAFVQETVRALRPGGVTVHADVLLVPDGFPAEQNRLVWQRRKEEAFALGLITEEEIREEEQRRKEYETGARKGLDDFLSHDQFVSAFRENGFPEADSIWRYWGLAVVAARR